MQFIDHTGYPLTLNDVPRRIVSLVPSITETLFALGLDKEVVAITDYCTAPETKLTGKPSVGGTKHFDFEMIHQLKPDLIIGEKEENYLEGIVALRKRYPVWTGHIHSINRAMSMIDTIGKMVDAQEDAGKLIRQIRESLELKTSTKTYRAAYLVWKDPYIAAGGGTFIDEMLACCGMENVFRQKGGYPRIEPAHLDQAEIILLASEPYPFSEQDGRELRNHIIDRTMLLVDGTLFSWYGYRMILSAAYFKKIDKVLVEKGLTSQILHV